MWAVGPDEVSIRYLTIAAIGLTALFSIWGWISYLPGFLGGISSTGLCDSFETTINAIIGFW